MKDILITHNCLVKGESQKAGTILRGVDTSTAAELLVSGRAVEHKAKVGTVEEKPEPKKKAAKKSAKKKAK